MSSQCWAAGCRLKIRHAGAILCPPHLGDFLQGKPVTCQSTQNVTVTFTVRRMRRAGRNKS